MPKLRLPVRVVPAVALLIALLAAVALWQIVHKAAPSAPAAVPRGAPAVQLASVAARPDEPIQPLPPLPALDPGKVELGRRLFHDRRLSADGSLSCASCHDLQRGGADGRALSTGVGGVQGEVHAPSVLTAALSFRQFWDGRAATLEEQAGGPIENPREMAASLPQVVARLAADPEMRQAFARLYPDGVTGDNIRHALAEFERSLPRPSRFDRWLRGDFNAIGNDERAGYQLFKKHGCIGCHQGANVGGNLYQRFGIMAPYFTERGTPLTRADLGRYNVSGRESDRHVFKVPSLRNVALTAPYFHDGSVAGLQDAVAAMGRYQLGIDLPAEDIRLIVAFLNTLTGESAP